MIELDERYAWTELVQRCKTALERALPGQNDGLYTRYRCEQEKIKVTGLMRRRNHDDFEELTLYAFDLPVFIRTLTPSGDATVDWLNVQHIPYALTVLRKQMMFDDLASI